MTSDPVTKKKLVDKSVRSMACEGRNEFTASYISKKIGVETDFVKERLLKLSTDGQLLVNFGIMCLYRECESRTIKKYSNINDIPIGHIIECPECGKEFEVTRENVWVTFSPNPNYYDKDMCINIEKIDVQTVKKKRCALTV